MFLEMQKVQLVEGDVWGHRKDIHEYYTVPDSIISKIRNMKAEGISDEKIAEKIAHESKLSPEMISYVLNKKNLE